MICRIRQDSELTEEERKALADAFYQAFSLRMGGKTEYLDAALAVEQ